MDVLVTNKSVPPAPTFALMVPSRFRVILLRPAVVDPIPIVGLTPLPCAAGCKALSNNVHALSTCRLNNPEPSPSIVLA